MSLNKSFADIVILLYTHIWILRRVLIIFSTVLLIMGSSPFSVPQLMFLCISCVDILILVILPCVCSCNIRDCLTFIKKKTLVLIYLSIFLAFNVSYIILGSFALGFQPNQFSKISESYVAGSVIGVVSGIMITPLLVILVILLCKENETVVKYFEL